jgi:Ca2+-binding EF-hand superfamily protein
MKSFLITVELQRTTLMHMIKTDIQKIEKDNLKMIFDALDDEKDGEIELKEFVI